MLEKKGVLMKRHFNFAVALCATALVGILAPASALALAVEEAAIPASPTFTKDVLPILQAMREFAPGRVSRRFGVMSHA